MLEHAQPKGERALLSETLIENALKLTGKTIVNMEEAIHRPNSTGKYRFSIEKFCYYLLSPEFIEKYSGIINWEYYFVWQEERMSATVWQAIYEYQSGNEQPLIDLLSKIWAK